MSEYCGVQGYEYVAEVPIKIIYCVFYIR